MTLQIEARRTALVLIDLQKGVLGMSLAPYPATQVLAAAVALGERLRAAGGLVVAVNVAFAADGADRLRQPVDVVPPALAAALPADWSVLAPEVAGLGGIRITKRQWGAFHGTELDLQLRRRGITTVLLAGIATNFGVEQTAREAWQHGYGVIVAEDACSGSAEGMHAFAVERILPRIARVRRAEEIAAALAA